MSESTRPGTFADVFRAVYRGLVRGAAPLAVYEILAKSLAAGVLGPLSAGLLAMLISFSGSVAVSNEQILSFALSPLGIAALGLSVSLGFLITFLEEAGLMSIASATYSGEPGSAVSALRQAFRRGRDLVGLALVTFVLGFVSFLPFAAAVVAAYSAWLTEYDINYYLAERPPAFWRAAAVGGVALVGLVLTWGWLYVRLMFALPACILANERPVAGLKTSLRLTKGSVLRMTAVLLTWLLLIAVFSGLVGAVVQVVEYVGIKAAGERLGVLIPTLAGLVTLNLVTAAVISLVTVTTNALVIVRLYHDAAAGEADLRPQQAGVPPVPAGLPHWLTTKRLLVGAALLFLGTTVAITYFLVEQIGIDDEVAITAHRAGCLSAPENTTSALEASIREGADFAEIDVQETADGVIVVLHDADLMRTARLRRNIWAIEYDELKSLDAGSWFSPEFRDQRIPTLKEMIDVARGRIRLNVELKFNGHDEKLVERVVRVLQENDFQSECVVSSLDYRALIEAKALDERLEIGHIVSVAIGNVTKLDVDFLSVNQENVTSRYVQSIHGADKQVHVWTVNDRKRMSSLVDLGVDNIITDDPATLRAVLDERAEMTNAERILLGFRNWLAR